MKNIIHVFALIVLFMSVIFQTGEAYELKSLDDSFPVISGGVLKHKESQPGTDFHATLGEDVEFQGMFIPEGTEFVGHVGKVSDGFLLIYPHIDIWIDQVIFPDGKKYVVYPNMQSRANARIKFNGSKEKAQSNWIDAGESLKLKFRPSIMKGLMDRGQDG